MTCQWGSRQFWLQRTWNFLYTILHASFQKCTFMYHIRYTSWAFSLFEKVVKIFVEHMRILHITLHILTDDGLYNRSPYRFPAYYITSIWCIPIVDNLKDSWERQWGLQHLVMILSASQWVPRTPADETARAAYARAVKVASVNRDARSTPCRG